MGIGSIHSINRQAASDQLALRSDLALAKRAARGDRMAFRDIVDNHRQRMMTVACSVIRESALAEDVVQEAFIKAYRAMSEFRGDSLLSTWLYRITYLTAIDMRRQRHRQQQLGAELQADPHANAVNSLDEGEMALRSSQLRQQIDSALTLLSPFEQTVFTLRHMQNFKLKEIALVVDRSEGTVKNILFRAIHKLRDQLSATVSNLQEIETC